MSISREDRVRGGLIGLLVGDALGVPYEFSRPENLPPRDALEMNPPATFHRAHRGVPAGTWSDDGALALALLDSLLTCGALELDDFSRRMLAWFEHGAYTPDGRVFDVGVQTSRAFRAILSGTSPEVSGPAAERDNGNGSLMRVLPLALFHDGTLAELAALAEKQSLPTHGHVRSRVACALYCVWARHELNGHTDGFLRAASDLRALYSESPEHIEVLDFHIRPDDESPGGGSGYVIDTLRSARDVLREPDFERTVKAAVALGHDTDTTACVAGGIAGIRHGVHAIPSRFRDALAGADIYMPLLDRLVGRTRSA